MGKRVCYRERGREVLVAVIQGGTEVGLQW